MVVGRVAVWYSIYDMATTAKRVRPKFSETHLLGLRSQDSLRLAKQVESGLSFSSLEKLSKTTGIPLDVLRIPVRISQRTLTRRRAEKRLSPEESDRLVSLSRLLALAIDLFEGDVPGAIRWFTSPNRGLGYVAPVNAAATAVGSREVENLIGRLEHGVFT